jgi:hypothetical protein
MPFNVNGKAIVWHTPCLFFCEFEKVFPFCVMGARQNKFSLFFFWAGGWGLWWGNMANMSLEFVWIGFFLFVTIRQTYSIFYIVEGSMAIHVELHALVVVNVLINFFNFISQIHVFIWFPCIYLFIFFVCLWLFCFLFKIIF